MLVDHSTGQTNFLVDSSNSKGGDGCGLLCHCLQTNSIALACNLEVSVKLARLSQPLQAAGQNCSLTFLQTYGPQASACLFETLTSFAV